MILGKLSQTYKKSGVYEYVCVDDLDPMSRLIRPLYQCKGGQIPKVGLLLVNATVTCMTYMTHTFFFVYSKATFLRLCQVFSLFSF